MFLGNITDLSLLHVTECGRLTNLDDLNLYQISHVSANDGLFLLSKKGKVFSRGQCSSQYNKRPTYTSLTFLTIFDQRKMSTITVRSMKKKSQIIILSEQRRKEKSFSLLPLDIR